MSLFTDKCWKSLGIFCRNDRAGDPNYDEFWVTFGSKFYDRFVQFTSFEDDRPYKNQW